MKVPFNDLGLQYQALRPEIQSALASVLERSAFIDGEEIYGFEEAFAAYCRAPHCVALSNGTDSLLLSLMAFGVGPGDEVIVPTQSFIATVEPIIHLGARPVFVDIDSSTYTLDTGKLESAITSKTRCIIAVHLYGYPADMPRIMEIARRHDIRVLEDSAQAHGAEIDGIRTGMLGDIASFSFYPGKNLGAYGDAGAIVTRHRDLAETVRRLRNHGREKGAKYEHRSIGLNCRMDTLQAAVLGVKLKYLEGWTERRRAIARRYNEGLFGFVKVPVEASGYRHVYHLYVIEAPEREVFMERMRERGVQTGVHYPIPLHAHAPVRERLAHPLKFEVAERNARHAVSLPLFPEMTDEQVEHVIESTREAIRRS